MGQALLASLAPPHPAPSTLLTPRPEQDAQLATTAPARGYEAAQRRKAAAYPLNLQEAKDAYRADSVRGGGLAGGARRIRRLALTPRHTAARA